MDHNKHAHKTGKVNIKSAAIPLAIGGFVVALGVSQVFFRQDNVLVSGVAQSLHPVVGVAAQSALVQSVVPQEKQRQDPSWLLPDSIARPMPKTANAEKSVLRLKDYIRNFEEKNSSLQEKIELLTSLLDSREQELLRLSGDNTQLKENLAATIDTQNKLKESFDAGLSALNVQIAQKDSELEVIRAAKLALENQMGALNAQIAALSDSHTALNSQITQLKSAKEVSETALAQLKDEVVRQQAMNEALTRNVAGLNESLAKKEQERLLIAQEMQQLQAIKNDTEAALSAERKSRVALEAELSNARDQINEQQVRHDGLNKNSVELKAVLLRKEQERQAIAAQLEQLQVAKADLEAELNKARQNKAGMESDFQSTKDAVSQQQAINDVLSKKVAELKAEIVRKEQERQAVADELEQVQIAKSSVEADLRKAKSSASSSSEQLTTQLQELQTAHAEAQQSVAQLSELLAQKEAELKKKQEEIVSIKNRVASIDSDKVEVTSALQEKEQVIHELSLQVEAYDTQLASLKKELTASKAQQSKADGQLRDVRSLNAALKNKMKNILIELELLHMERGFNSKKEALPPKRSDKPAKSTPKISYDQHYSPYLQN